MAIQNVYLILSPAPEGGGKEHLETCQDCGTPFFHTDPDLLYKRVANHIGIKPEWYMVRYERAEKMDIQPSLKTPEALGV